jgi:hypothetical protein
MQQLQLAALVPPLGCCWRLPVQLAAAAAAAAAGDAERWVLLVLKKTAAQLMPAGRCLQAAQHMSCSSQSQHQPAHLAHAEP